MTLVPGMWMRATLSAGRILPIGKDNCFVPDSFYFRQSLHHVDIHGIHDEIDAGLEWIVIRYHATRDAMLTVEQKRGNLAAYFDLFEAARRVPKGVQVQAFWPIDPVRKSALFCKVGLRKMDRERPAWRGNAPRRRSPSPGNTRNVNAPQHK